MNKSAFLTNCDISSTDLKQACLSCAQEISEVGCGVAAIAQLLDDICMDGDAKNDAVFGASIILRNLRQKISALAEEMESLTVALRNKEAADV